ncbi:MAG: hypothetical protein CL899_00460 [Dehalococcoidia bacterium]|nr:hypothetical protein [Dehalococcoidia bacterium]
MKKFIIKIIFLGMVAGLSFSIFYLLSSYIICSFLATCSIDWKNYIIGCVAITSIFTFLVSVVSIFIKYIYDITKV